MPDRDAAPHARGSTQPDAYVCLAALSVDLKLEMVNELIEGERTWLRAADETLSVAVELERAMNYALANNGVSPLKGVEIASRSAEPITGLSLTLSLEAPISTAPADPMTLQLPEVPPELEGYFDARSSIWPVNSAAFAQIDEAMTATVTARITGAGHVLQAAGNVSLLAHDEWWARSIPESLAAFVTPRAPAVRDLLGEASALLQSRTKDPSLQGYQVGADRAVEIARAIYDAVAAREIRYINPPPSFEGTGQKIRSPDDVLIGRWGTCLDLATTYAAALEGAGLNPVLFVCDGHAFAGFLREDQQLVEQVVADQTMIMNYVESGLLIAVETTCVCAGESSQRGFDAAVAATRAALSSIVRHALDVRSAHRYVRPLPAISSANGVRVVEVERDAPPPPVVAAPQQAAFEPAVRGALSTRETYPPRVDRWRGSLLDLSLRNPLLNMRTGRAALELHVPAGALGSIEDRLFAGESYRLSPNDQLAELHLVRGARTAADIEPEDLRRMLDAGDMFVACPQSSYLARLRGLVRRARTIREETGANNLFLTLGLLEWQENGRVAHAPLFILPVNVVGHRGRPFTLHIEDGAAAQPNQCLVEKLRRTHQLEIPQLAEPETDESGIDVPGSIQAIRRALIDAGLPFAVQEAARLALLQFSTMQMWQDVSANWSTFMRNPVVRHFIETPTDSFADPVVDDAVPVDAESITYCPVAFDGYQLEAISRAQAGQSFVIEGPPGTGKSQTITNLIANAVAAGKTVMFVAEKQAALDVVRRRLANVGVGELCLNLHGRTQSPEDVRAQLRRALELRVESNLGAWETTRADFRTMTGALSRYPRALHESGGAGLSAWQARQALLDDWDGPTVTVSREVVSRPVDTEAMYRVAADLTQSLYDLGMRYSEHPWRLSDLHPTAVAERRTAIAEAVGALDHAMTDLSERPVRGVVAAFDGTTGLALAAEWAGLAAAAEWVIEVETLRGRTDGEWDREAAKLSDDLGALVTDAAPALTLFVPAVVSAVSLDALYERAQAADHKLFKGKARRQVVQEMAAFIIEGAEVNAETITSTLGELIALRDRVTALASRARSLPGMQTADEWNPLDPTGAERAQTLIAALRRTVALMNEHPRLADALGVLSGSMIVNADARSLDAAARAEVELMQVIDVTPSRLQQWLGDRPLVDGFTEALPMWSGDAAGGLVALSRWTEVQSRCRYLREAGLDELMDGVESGTIRPDEIESTLRRAVARAALEERLSGPVLDGFDGVAHERSIARFATAGTQLRREMVTELPAKIVRERSFSADRLVGRVGALSRELGRKRGGLKVRELFENYGPIITELTPCLMMSPASVAQFLPPDALEIDIAVFDEASQIKVAEAVGAMGRAAATIVVGDSKQMPPTDVAGVSLDSDDDASLGTGEGVPVDMESVLSEAVESNLPRLWLSWHYRSQHESLIAFSNERYYDSRLASFPTPPGARDGAGVLWRRVQGTFESGGARVNRVEAEAIVADVRQRFAGNASASVGVVTFNIQQRDLILDLLEETGDQTIAEALSDETEPLFVKNLENVQGDERDVILFSLAFSPHPQTGRLGLNFGPLTRSGGERRLNVAITRARAQVVVYSSFDPEHIELTRTSSQGLADLRGYLERARRRDTDTAILRPAPARDRHQEDVVTTLREAGLEVRERLGLSDFTVDVAIAESPEGPWTAIFLDGPAYAARRSVADRETLPYEVLHKHMGWAGTQRIWLPDWIRDRDEVVQRLRGAVKTAGRPTASDPDVTPRTLDPSAEDRLAAAAPPSLINADELELARVKDPNVASATLVRASMADVTASGTAHRDGALPPGAEPFEAADDDVRGSVEVLDNLGSSLACQSRVRAEIHQVLAREAPVAANRLTRIVGRRFGLQRVAAKRSQEMLALVSTTQRETTGGREFVWATEQIPDEYETFRVPAGDPERTLEEIPTRELANAMRYLARTGGGILPEELLRETNALFGFSRMAAKSRNLLEAALREALERGTLGLEGDAIVAAD